MEDQGIMALPMGGMQGPTAQPPAQLFDPAASAAFEQVRQQIDPREFGQELLSAAEQTDPAAVQQFKQAIERMQLPPEVIDALGQMVDAILAEPQNYAQIRQEFINEGVPEDLLPPEFDAVYFGAMNLALDQMSGSMQSMNVQKFAEGGIATLTPIAKMLSSYGRNGDTMLAHITPAEARMLRRRGGSGTINPITGLPEFFIKRVAKAVGNTLKSVGKAVSGAVKGIVNGVKKFAKSSVGKIITTVALGFFLGPAAASFLGVTSAAGVAAVGGFVGGFGSSILAGQSLKDSLKSGAIGGLTAGVTAGITGGMGAFEAGSYGGPTTISGQWDRAVNSGKSLLGISTPSTAGTSISAEQLGTSVDSIDAAAGNVINPPTVPTTAELAATPVSTAPPVTPASTSFSLADAPGAPGQLGVSPQGFVDPAYRPDLAAIEGGPVSYDITTASPYTTYTDELTNRFYSNQPLTDAPGRVLTAGQGAGSGSFAMPMDASSASVAGAPVNAPFTPPGGTFDATGSVMPIDAPGTATAGFQRAPSAMDYFRQGEYLKGAKETFMPTSYSNAQLIQSPEYMGYKPEFGSKEALRMASADLNPGMFRTYGPAVAAGVGALGLAGGFSPKEEPPPDNANRLYGSQSGAQLLASSPQIYGTTPGGAATQYYSPGYMGYGLPTRQYYRPQIMFGQPQYRYGFAEGGIASLAKGGSTNFPRKTGPINGPGTATSDSIPAMLSDGEFVFTAKAVRNMGKGSRRLGAKRMYALMKALEGK